MSDLAITTFDFTQVDESVRTQVIQRDVQFDTLKEQVEHAVFKMGRLLIEQKKDLQHGQWLQWLHCKGMDPSGASRLIKISEKYSNCAPAHNLNISVLTLIAQDNTPESAREEIIAKAEAGENVTKTQAQEIIKLKKENDALKAENRNAYKNFTDEYTDHMANLIGEKKKLEDRIRELEQKTPEIVIQEPEDYISLKQQLLVLNSKIDQQEKELNKWEHAEKELQVVNLITDATKSMREALVLMENPACSESVLKMVKNLISELNDFVERCNTIDV